MNDFSDYGPLKFFIGEWESQGHQGENRAPDEERNVENTKFRQWMKFTPIGEQENHEQALMGLQYENKAWEQGEDGEEDELFHQEIGYFLFDKDKNEVIKCFTIPRGMAILAGGKIKEGENFFTLVSTLGENVYGLTSNPFLDKEFQTIRYTVTFKILDQDTFSYDENTELKIKGQVKIFDHTEKNTLKRKKA